MREHHELHLQEHVGRVLRELLGCGELPLHKKGFRRLLLLLQQVVYSVGVHLDGRKDVSGLVLSGRPDGSVLQQLEWGQTVSLFLQEQVHISGHVQLPGQLLRPADRRDEQDVRGRVRVEPGVSQRNMLL